tara:strand:- start:1054 stop:1644 length:591 start_codon:yes stop_codon:yes gene_type:complete
MKSKNWINRQKKDQFVIKSKQKGFLSRSAFKLIEIETKFNFIKNSKNIIDLGASPGGWCQVIFQFNQSANVTAIDSLNLKFLHSNIDFIKNDFTKIDFKYLNKKYDLILSDLAPNTTGHQSTDHLRISNIVNKVIENLNFIANLDSNFVIKIWKGSEESSIIKLLKQKYKKVSYFKPESSRKESSEIYIVGQKFIN